MTKTITAVVVLAILMAAGPASAIDHKNLDEGRPLRLEDAYPISSGEIAVEVGGGFRLARRGSDQGFFPIEVLYGAFPNFQLGVGTTCSPIHTKWMIVRSPAIYTSALFTTSTRRRSAFQRSVSNLALAHQPG